MTSKEWDIDDAEMDLVEAVESLSALLFGEVYRREARKLAQEFLDQVRKLPERGC